MLGKNDKFAFEKESLADKAEKISSTSAEMNREIEVYKELLRKMASCYEGDISSAAQEKITKNLTYMTELVTKMGVLGSNLSSAAEEFSKIDNPNHFEG